MGVTKDEMTMLKSRWHGMRERCYNAASPSYQDYGMLGVRMCDDWYSTFEMFFVWAIQTDFQKNFAEGRTSIDRINAWGDYCPENCRWATDEEQCANKRVHNVHDGSDEFLYREEVAEMLNRTPGWVSENVKNGRIPVLRLGSAILFSKTIIELARDQILRTPDQTKCHEVMQENGEKKVRVKQDGKTARPAHVWTPEEDYILLHSVGRSSRDVASQLGVNQTTVYQRAVKLGFTWKQIKRGEAIPENELIPALMDENADDKTE